MTQTGSTTLAPTAHPLEPLQRLSLRDQLQDLWRSKVEQITTLAVRFHSTEFETDPTEDPIVLARRLSQLRLDLTEVEAAMRRMDVGQYGRCDSCATSIAYDELSMQPDRRRCVSCEPAERGWDRSA